MTNDFNQTSSRPVVKAVTYFLAQVPGMIRHGSKPAREISKQPTLLKDILGSLNSFEQAVAYPPNQVFIGNLEPDDLHQQALPWYQNGLANASRNGPFGEIMPEDEFLGMMKICDQFELICIETGCLEQIIAKLEKHPLIQAEDLNKIRGKGISQAELAEVVERDGAMPLYINGNDFVGCCRSGDVQDFNLIPDILIENLANRASGVMALRHLTSKYTSAEEIDYLIGCGEEAVGDRYNRGGGNMAKAIGELAGCLNATGSDTKAFCCAPVHAMVLGSGLIASGIFKNVCVVAGGSFAKLGMKFYGHLKHNMPILEDSIAGIAILMGEDDGESPVLRIDSIGKHAISAGSSQQDIFQKLVIDPLDKLGLKLTDIDKFATEMHNPELTEPQGSGNVPKTNYRVIASFAVLRQEIERQELDDFVYQRGMLGFSPTQGHIASAVPVLGHAVRKMKSAEMNRALFLAKGSLFLGRMTQLSDGISFILEKNNRRK